MTTFAVGQPINPAKHPMPEGVLYQLDRGGHAIHAIIEDPTEPEVKAYRFGKVEVAVYVEQPVIYLLFRAGTQPWCAAPYSWHLVRDEYKPTFDLPEQDVALAAGSATETLTLILVDARNSIVRALRVVSMPAAVSEAIRTAMRTQAVTPWDERAYDRALQRLEATLTTEQLLEAAKARGVAGK